MELEKEALKPAFQWQLSPEWSMWLSPPPYLPKTKALLGKLLLATLSKQKEGRQRAPFLDKVENCPREEGEADLCGAAKELTLDERQDEGSLVL